MLIYLIRHGETTSDIEDRYGGDYDDHLTDEGRSQVETLAEKLKGLGIEKIYASPKIRAQESAKIIADKLGVEIETEKDLRERNQYGILTGMVKSEAKEKYPKLVEDVKNPLDTVEGAEDFESFRKRVIAAFEKVTNGKEEKIAIVSHGGPVRRIISKIKNLPLETKMDLANCALITIQKDNNGEKITETDGVEIKQI